MAWTTPRDWTDGEFVNEAMLDAHVRDNLKMVPHRIPKTADQSVTSSTVLVDDTHLQFVIGSNEAWEFSLTLATTGPGFLKVALNAPAAATGWWAVERTTAGDVSLDNSWIAAATFVDGETVGTATNPDRVTIEGFCLNSSTAGTLKLRWAQLNSNGTATVIRRGSRLERRLV